MIISEESSFTIFWKIFDLINCIISSYIYAWLAAFGDQASGVFITDLSIFFECCFTVTMFLHFVTDYTPEGERVPIRELSKISKRYFFSQKFLLDFLTLIPFQILLKGQGHQVKVLYLIKIIRFLNGIKFFDVDMLYRTIKSKVHIRL